MFIDCTGHTAAAISWFTRLLLVFAILVSATDTSQTLADGGRQKWREQALQKVETLKDCRGQKFSAGRLGHVLVFLRAGCPLADRYIRPIERLAGQHGDVSFTVVLVSTGTDTQQIEKWLRTRRPEVRSVIDSGALTRFFEVAVSPEAFVIDSYGELIYRGMIDDQHLPTRSSLEAPNHRYLHEVLTELESGRHVFPRFTVAKGCHLQDEPTEFNRHIAPVVYGRCAICHRPGDIKEDLPLTSYEEISASAKTIEWRFEDGFMPPWRASHRGVEFSNDLSLSLNEMWRFSDWIRNDMPVDGEPASAPVDLSEHAWRIPNPDAVVDIGEDYRVPAEGRLPYQYFLVDSPFDEDRWITATEVRPGAPNVVHHINVFLLPPPEERESRARRQIELRLAMSRLRDRGDVVDAFSLRMGLLLYGLKLHRRIRFLSDFNPAESTTRFAPGTGFLLRKDAQIVFEIHYTPNGYAEEVDRSLLALHAADKIPDDWQVREPVTRVVGHMGRIRIKPGGTLTLTKSLPFFADVELLSLKPHMHYRGSRVEVTLVNAEGDRQTLLDIPRWDYEFQMPYIFKTPVHVRKGSQLQVRYDWDNTPANPNISLEDTKKPVKFGFQTEEEMSMAYPTYRYLNATPQQVQHCEARVTRYLEATTLLPIRDDDGEQTESEPAQQIQETPTVTLTTPPKADAE